MLTCAEIVALVSDYIDGRLDPEAKSQFEAHVSICPPCRAYLAQMRETKTQLGRLTEEDLPAEMQASLLQAFRDWKDVG